MVTYIIKLNIRFLISVYNLIFWQYIFVFYELKLIKLFGNWKLILTIYFARLNPSPIYYIIFYPNVLCASELFNRYNVITIPIHLPTIISSI